MAGKGRTDSLSVDVAERFVVIKLENLGPATTFNCKVNLTVDEAREIADSLVDAVNYIKLNGLLKGDVDERKSDS